MKFLIAALAFVWSASAAEFQSGQAARAVIGQSSFSSREPGIAAHALSIARGRLYAADSTNHVQAFDLAKIPNSKEELAVGAGLACSLCGFPPVAVSNQSVFQGVAATAVFGKTAVIADAPNHRVLIWRGPSSTQKPDVILARMFLNPVSVAFDGKRLFVGDAEWHRVLVWNSLPSTDDAPPDEVLGQPDLISATLAEGPNAASLRNPSALVSDGTNLFVADAQDRRILVFSPGEMLLSKDTVVNSASLISTPFAPGTLLTLQALALTDTSGLQVLLNGAPLPLLSLPPEDIQVQIPYDLGGASAGSLYVRTEHGVTTAIPLKFIAASPGIFAFGAAEPRSGLLLHAEAASPITPETPAEPGEVVTVWATGLGQVDPQDGTPLRPLTAVVNGEPAQVLSARLPHDSVGVYEVRVLVPTAHNRAYAAQLFLTQSGSMSNTVTFPLQLREQ